MLSNANNLWRDLYELQLSFFVMCAKYYSFALHNFVEESQKGMDKSFYDRWIIQMDNNLDKELRTKDFANSLSEHLLILARFIKDSRYYGLEKLVKQVIDYNPNKYILDNLISVYNIDKNKSNVTDYYVIEVIDGIELIRFVDKALGKNGSKPVLLVYAQINRFNIMDLTVEKSVVKNLMANGLDVYLLKWDDLAYHNSSATLEDYAQLISKAVDLISSKTLKEKIPIIGYCWGGTLAAIYSSLFPDKVLCLGLVASPIDFSKDNSILAQWSRSLELDKIIDELGYMEGTLLDIAFILRNPPRHLFDKYYRLHQKLNDKQFVELFLSVERWLNNTPDIPGPYYKRFIQELYKENNLVKGKLSLSGYKRVDLSNATIPIMTVTSSNDDLVSPDATEAISDHVMTSVNKIHIPGGHVGLCIGKKAHENAWPEMANWITSNYVKSGIKLDNEKC